MKAWLALLLLFAMGCSRPTMWVSLPDHVHDSKATCLVEGIEDAEDVFCRMSHGEKLVACVALEPHAVPNQATWSCELRFPEPGEWRLEHFAFRREGRVHGPFHRSLKVEVMR